MTILRPRSQRTGAPMTSSALFAFLHHAAAFLLVAVVMVELVLLRGELTVASARTLLRMDSVYGLSAVVLLIVGFVRVFSTGEGRRLLLSQRPLPREARVVHRRRHAVDPADRAVPRLAQGAKEARLPALDDGKRRRLRMFIHIELTLLFVIMLCAALMARGIGFIG